jgi:RNA polymerase sigma-70 factor (ECF subfamily)
MTASLALPVLHFPAAALEDPVANGLSEDGALARAACGGDRQAFSQLVDRYKRPALGLCFRMLRNSDEAADAAQESFVRAYASLDRFDPKQPFGPWLMRIARNRCLDVLRQRVPTERGGLNPTEEDDQPVREIADERAVRGDDALEKQEERVALEKAVADLPVRYREVISLYHEQQLSYQEVAQVMGIPLGTVMTWLHRARKQLRTSLTLSEMRS